MECFGGWEKGEPGEARGGGGQHELGGAGGARAGKDRAGQGKARQGKGGPASNQTKIQFKKKLFSL